MVVEIPDLGETWEDAIKSAYKYGYNTFEGEYSYELVKEKMREWEHEEGQTYAIDMASNDASVQQTINTSSHNRKLWEAIDDFYREHRTEEEYEHFRAEAVVAEDIYISWEAGAYDALLGNEPDLDEVMHLA